MVVEALPVETVDNPTWPDSKFGAAAAREDPADFERSRGLLLEDSDETEGGRCTYTNSRLPPLGNVNPTIRLSSTSGVVLSGGQPSPHGESVRRLSATQCRFPRRSVARRAPHLEGPASSCFPFMTAGATATGPFNGCNGRYRA